jgi:hypothetical protein
MSATAMIEQHVLESADAEANQNRQLTVEVRTTELEPTFDSRLLAIADKIDELHVSLTQLFTTAVGRCRSLGDLLNEAKRLCPSGHWLRYLAHCKIPERRAQECMRIAMHWSELEANTNSCADLLKLREVRQLLPPKRPKADPKPKPHAQPTSDSEGLPERAEQAPEDDRSSRASTSEVDQHRLPDDEQIVPRAATTLSDPEISSGEGGEAPPTSRSLDPATNEEVDVRAWLFCHPLGAKLEDPSRFDQAVLQWWAVKPILDELRRLVPPEAYELGRGALPSLARNSLRLRLIFAAFVNPPEKWIVCSVCKGRPTGRPGAKSCSFCDDNGFLVTHQGDSVKDPSSEDTAEE